MPKRIKENLWGPYLQGPPLTEISSKESQWAGRTTLSSGSSTVTVSTQLVNSDSVILAFLEFNTAVTSGQTIGVHVESLNPGNHFDFATDDGQAPSQDVTIMWLMYLTSDP